MARVSDKSKNCSALFTLGLIAAIAAAPNFISTAQAQGNNCLKNISGSTIRWDAAWQSDRLDNDVSYRVNDTVHVDNGSTRTVTIELTAMTPSEKADRYLTINSNTFAAKVCARLTRRKTSMGKSKISRTSRKGKRSERLRFIHYTARGWVRADPPPQKTLTKCSIMGKTFLCLEDEKKRFGEQLKTVEAEIRAQPELYR